MKKLIMLITAISLLPAYIFAAGDVMEDKTLGEKISEKIEKTKQTAVESAIERQPLYIAMRYYIDKDDGEGLKKYISEHEKLLRPDDFYDVYRVVKYIGTRGYSPSRSLSLKEAIEEGFIYKRHKFCYALTYGKVKVAKALTDLENIPESCVNVSRRDYSMHSKIYFGITGLSPRVKRAYGTGDIYWNAFAASNSDSEWTVTKNAEVSCYALEKGLMIKPWKENGTLKIAREGKCVDAYLNKMPLENLLDKDNLSAYTAKEFKRLLAKRDVKLNYEQLEWVKNSLGYEDRKEIFGTKKAKIISLGLSDENWQTLIEQIGDDLSFAYQSMSILYEVSDSDNSTLGKQKESYEKCIKKLDDAYKKYVKSLGGISVSETAKANYELTKQVLTDGMAQLEQPIAEEKEQKRIAAEKAKKEAAEAKEEKFRKDLVSKAFKGNEEKAEIFFNSASKNIDKNKDLNAMYFPNGAKVCFTWQFGPDCTEYITPILVVYQDIKWDSYRQVFDGTSSDETYNWGYNVYIYNAEGKLIEKKEKTTDGLDVKDRKEPEKYKLSASKGGWNWKHRGGC